MKTLFYQCINAEPRWAREIGALMGALIKSHQCRRATSKRFACIAVVIEIKVI